MRQTPVAVSQNFLAGLSGGLQAGQQVQQVNNQNALRALGPGLLAGDPGALERLAAIDPMQAMAIQNHRTDNQRQDRRMQMDQQLFDLRLQEYKAKVGDAEAAKTAQRINEGLGRATQFYRQGNLGALNMMLAEVGEQPIQSLDQFPAMAAQYQSVAEALGRSEPPEPDKPADEYGRYVLEERAAGREPLSRIDYKRAGRATTQTRVTPDGGVEIIEGFGGQGASLPKTTEGEKSSAGYLSRMRAAERTLDELAADGDTTRSITSLLLGGTNLEGLALNDQQSKLLQAQRDWVRAKLRKESGAVIGIEEMAEEVRTYFPLPGEGPEIVEQKRRARMQAERQLEIMSGNAASQAGSRTEPTGDNPFVGTTDEDLINIDILSLSPDEQRQLLEALGQ